MADVEVPAPRPHWRVPSGSQPGKEYIVAVADDGRLTCTCKGFEYRQVCKHTTAYVLCGECDYWYEINKGACQNPACFPGYAAYLAAANSWDWQRRQAWREDRFRMPTLAYFDWLVAWEKLHPAPRTAAFRQAQQGG